MLTSMLGADALAIVPSGAAVELVAAYCWRGRPRSCRRYHGLIGGADGSRAVLFMYHLLVQLRIA